MGLNARQKEAVEYLDGPLLVLAGPGTGKTQLLSSKVEYILKNTDTAPGNILCLTFTDTGAQNMRERLKRIVGPEGAKVNVGTYHAFGTDILAQYKEYSETYNRKMDDAIEGVRQFMIVKELMEKLPATDLLRGDKVKDVLDIIGDAKGAQLTAEDLATIATQNIEDSRVVSEAISPLLRCVVPRKFKESLEGAYQPIYSILKDYKDMPLIMPRVARNIVKMSNDLEEAMNAALEKNSVKPLSDWKDDYFVKDEKGNYRLKDRVKNLKLMSIAKVMAMYDEYLRENGLYDFDDMINEAVRVLATDEGFKLTLEERYQYIMLDEFQDTNPAQLAIVKNLTDYEKPNVMAVGDDDQGIYAFQGALSSNMADFERYYGAHVVRLEENYRSTQEILDFSMEIMKQEPERYEKELRAVKPSPEKSQIERHEFLSSDAECAYIAKRIAELVRAGVPQHEIAVISYRTKYFEPLLPFLKEYPEIKIAYDKQDNVLEDPKIHALVTLARYVTELAAGLKPSVSVMEILGYDFWGLNVLELVKLVDVARREHRSLFDKVTEIADEGIRQVAEFIVELAAKSFTEPFEIMLDYMTGARELGGYRSPFLRFYTDESHSDDYAVFHLYENLATLRETLVRYYQKKSPKLADLTRMLDDYEIAGETISVTSPYKEASSAVQIMTAHKAKGLEYEYVFILTADTNAWGKGSGNHEGTRLPDNVTFIHHTGMTDGERLRVLYVALTRAKSHIIITNALHDFTGKARGRLEYFQEYEEDDKVILPFLPDRIVQTHYEVDVAEATKSVRNWFERYFEPQPELSAYYLEKAARIKYSASAITKFVNVVYGGPQEFMKDYLMPRMDTPETESQVYGTLIHQTFEYVTNNLATDEVAVEYFLSALEETHVPSEMLTTLREKGPANLAVALREFRSVLENGKAEVDFAPDKLVVDGVRVTGRIDHIVIDEAAKTIEVYDFKTSKYDKTGWRSSTSNYMYMLQLIFYKMLLNNSPRFAKYTVERAHLLYVVPDADGEVYDKVYQYNEADEEEFRKLFAAVTRMVSDLSFMKDPDVFIEPDGGKGVKEVREFVQMLIDKNANV